MDVVYTTVDIELNLVWYNINVLLAVIVNAVAVYVILKHSTKQMGVYKYYLLYMVLGAMAFDLHLSFVFAPLLLFPFPGVCAAGYLTRGKGPEAVKVNVILTQIFMSVCGTSILYGGLYRYKALFGNVKCMASTRNVLLMLGVSVLYPLPSIFPIFFHDFTASQAQIIDYAHKYAAGVVPILEQESCYSMIDPKQFSTWILTGFTQSMVVCMLGAVLAYKIFYGLSSIKPGLSPRTFRLHKQLIFALICQCVVPVVCLIIPFCVGFILLSTKTETHVMKAFGMVVGHVITLHSTANGLMTIVCIQPYRSAVVNLLKRSKTKTIPNQPSSRIVPTSCITTIS